MTRVAKWVRDFVEGLGGVPPFDVGDIVLSADGRPVIITSGRYWGEYGVSNFWYWRELKSDGSLGPEEHGYGWNAGVPPSHLMLALRAHDLVRLEDDSWRLTDKGWAIIDGGGNG